MPKRELPEKPNDIERKNLQDPQYAEEEEVVYKEDLRRFIKLIFDGDAIPEAGITESGKLKWLKIFTINKKTDEKQELLFYIDRDMEDFEKIIKNLYFNGIEPKSITIPD